MDFSKIFDLERWEQLQDMLSEVTQMAILIVDFKGKPVTKHSKCQAFCKNVREDEKLSHYCQQCDSRAGFEAMKSNRPYIYKCHFSIIDMAIPIIVNNHYMGAIMAGQIRCSDESGKLEQLLMPHEWEYIEEKKRQLEGLYEAFPVLTYERIKTNADMLYYLCNYVCAEIVKRQDALSIYETVFDDRIISEPIEKDSDESTLLEEYNSQNEIIKNAFEYIYHNKNNAPSLKEVADYCHVSAGYMSRLFSKEVGETYSSFLTKLKVNAAKALLETSAYTINEISEMLGYSDTGYFIRVFKKTVGVTPLVYKKYCKIVR